jgi:inositol-phosphate phosphatase/L-galactose 1-phosphate phosphatase/histidinol-phosphatase
MVHKAWQELAQRMADAAGDTLRSAYRAPASIECKDDASPVTAADRAVENAMRELVGEYAPEHGIIGEEFGNIKAQADYQWILDPIDGTRSFIAGYPIFTTLIALAKQRVPLLGIIDQPVTRERWTGIAGEPTHMNGQAVYTSGQTALGKAVAATTSTGYFTPAQAERFAALKKQVATLVYGGDAYAYAMLASGRIDMVADAGMKPYDFCALRPVVEGAGGVITDWNGQPLTIDSDGCVLAAASKALHQAALTILRPAAA